MRTEHGGTRHPMRSLAFTMVELLVVIAIIGLLIAMLMPVLNRGIFNARALDTEQRIQQVHNSLARLGSFGEGTASTLQKALSIGGVQSFKLDNTTGVASPDAGTWLDYSATWEPGRYHHLRFPWGRQRAYFQGNQTVTYRPRTYGLSQISPLRSDDILAAIGFLDGRNTSAYPTASEAYAKDRSRSMSWNDKWGNPLVVAYAFQQYGPVTNDVDPMPSNADTIPSSTAAARTFERQRRSVEAIYRMGRSIYIAVGAVGPRARSTFDLAADHDGALRALWLQINDVCNNRSTGVASSWTDIDDVWKVDYGTDAVPRDPPLNAMDAPPWKGVRRSEKNSERSFLSTPVQYP